jgi:hypothetical protein
VTGNSRRASDVGGRASRAKAAVNAPQSRRFAKFEDAWQSRRFTSVFFDLSPHRFLTLGLGDHFNQIDTFQTIRRAVGECEARVFVVLVEEIQQRILVFEKRIDKLFEIGLAEVGALNRPMLGVKIECWQRPLMLSFDKLTSGQYLREFF